MKYAQFSSLETLSQVTPAHYPLERDGRGTSDLRVWKWSKRKRSINDYAFLHYRMKLRQLACHGGYKSMQFSGWEKKKINRQRRRFAKWFIGDVTARLFPSRHLFRAAVSVAGKKRRFVRDDATWAVCEHCNWTYSLVYRKKVLNSRLVRGQNTRYVQRPDCPCIWS